MRPSDGKERLRPRRREGGLARRGASACAACAALAAKSLAKGEVEWKDVCVSSSSNCKLFALRKDKDKRSQNDSRPTDRHDHHCDTSSRSK